MANIRNRICGVLPLPLLLIAGCEHATIADVPLIRTDALVQEGYCAGFVKERPGSEAAEIRLRNVWPASIPDSLGLDYLHIRIYGYEPRQADVSACEYFSTRAEVPAGTFGKDGSSPISLRILAVLNPANGHYLSIEGYQRRNAGDKRILGRNAPPVHIVSGMAAYTVDSLAWIPR